MKESINFLNFLIFIFYAISVTKQNFLTNNDSNFFFLSQEQNTIKFNLTKYSSYIFYLNQTYAPEDKIYFWSKWSSMRDTYVYYYYTNTQDIEELKKESEKRLNPKDWRDRKCDGYTYVSYDQFQISLDKTGRRLVFIMFPKVNDTEYYIRAIFYQSSEISSNIFYNFNLRDKKYIIYKYRQRKFYNNSQSSLIYANINNPDCSLNIYKDINELYLDKIKNNALNLKEEKWKTFNYTSGDIYFVISNFYIYSDYKSYSFSILNNNEYYNISYKINKYSNHSFHMKFPNTQNQFLTFSLLPYYYYYIYFDITPTNLRINVSISTTDNKTITPVDNKYYYLNTLNNIFFKIFLNSDTDFNEFNIKIQKIDNIPNDNDNIVSNKLVIGIIISLGGIQLLMFIIYMIKMKYKNKDRDLSSNNKDQKLINSNG